MPAILIVVWYAVRPHWHKRLRHFGHVSRPASVTIETFFVSKIMHSAILRSVMCEYGFFSSKYCHKEHPEHRMDNSGDVLVANLADSVLSLPNNHLGLKWLHKRCYYAEY